MTIEASNLDIELGGARVLSGVNLKLEGPQNVAIIGPNGAGKSTLLRALAGLIEPSRGSAHLNGYSTAEMTRLEVARELSYMPQSRAPAFDFSVFEFVLMGLHARMGRFSLEGQNQRSAALRALERVELAHAASRGVQTLSGGEYQRCVLARTLVADTSIWLLDEPTSELDPKHRLSVHRLVRRRTEGGALALTVLHDLHHAARFFDHVVILVDGRIQAHGTPDEVMQAELLDAVFDTRLERIETAFGPTFVPA